MRERERGGVVNAVLPGGTVVRVRVTEEAGDGIRSVGRLDQLDLEGALAEVVEVAALVRTKIESALPTKATVEFGVRFSAKTGKLSALVFEGKADASLTVILEWGGSSHTESSHA